MKVVITAAGMGKRFYPLTKAQPKEMLPILDKPVIHYVVEEAVRSGLDQILIVTANGKDALINYFDSHELDEAHPEYGFQDLPELFFVRQKEQLGLGNAVYQAKKFVGNDPFLLLLGDSIYTTDGKVSLIKQVTDVFKKKDVPVIAVQKVPKEKIKDYGIIGGEKIEPRLWRITEMMEKPEPDKAPSDLAISGIYALKPTIFDYIKKTKPGKNGEYQLTDALKLQMKEETVLGYELDGAVHDIGTKELWMKTFVEFMKKDPHFSKLLS
jgi:UTP--glucose-1-phosphate uridylyltransferase